MKSRVSLLLSGCIVSAGVIAGCSSNDQTAQTPPAGGGSTSTTTKTTGGKQLRLAFVTNNASDYWTIARKGVEKADGELDNVTVEFKMPGQGTAADQTQLVDDLLSKGTDGFAISPVDPANQTDLLNRAAKQALVFTQDSDVPKSNRVCYIGTNNVAAARMAGEQVKKALPNGGRIMAFVGKKDAQNAAERYRGLQESLKNSKVQILDIRTDETDHAKAKSNVSDALVKYPDLSGWVGPWAYNGPAILSAVKDAHKIGKVKIVAFDEEDDTLAGVKSGAIEATIVQQPFEFGYRSVVNMNKYLNGDKSVVPSARQIFVPTKAITKADVDAFRANLNKLRGR